MSIHGNALKGHLDVVLLSILAERSAHGYTIIEQLRERSVGIFDLPEGTIYPALHRLEQQGFLKSSWAVDSGRKRRIYSLTRRGKGELSSGKQRWDLFARGMERTLGAASQ